MSDRVLERLTQAVERLTLAVDSRTHQLRQTESPATSSVPIALNDAPETQEPNSTVTELSRVPFPEQFTLEVARNRFRGLDDGPGEVPEFILARAREALSSKAPGIEARVQSAYRAGFWAQIAIATHTPYQSREPLPGLRACHRVVLRSCFPSPFRVSVKRDIAAICDSRDATVLVCEGFSGLFELEIYCLAASSVVPPLRTC